MGHLFQYYGCKRGRRGRRGQISIEYIGGFMIFIVVVMWIVFAIVNTIPSYFAAAGENSIRSESWELSERILSNLSADGVIGRGLINASALAPFEVCNLTSYKDIRRAFNITEGDADFLLTIDLNPAIFLNGTNGANYTASAFVNGSSVNFESFKSNAPNATYDRVIINLSTLEVNNFVTITGTNYTVVRLSQTGRLVILERREATCGLNVPSGYSTARVVRLANLKGANDSMPVQIKLQYWRYR